MKHILTRQLAAGAGLAVLQALGMAAPARAQVCHTICDQSWAGVCAVYKTICTEPGQSSAPSQVSYPWGAIVFSPASKFFGYANAASTEQEAKDTALAQCRTKLIENGVKPDDCKIAKDTAVWFQRPKCGALATASGGQWGIEFGISAQQAKEKALSTCKSAGGANCEVQEKMPQCP
jgi:hypothetical protein